MGSPFLSDARHQPRPSGGRIRALVKCYALNFPDDLARLRRRAIRRVLSSLPRLTVREAPRLLIEQWAVDGGLAHLKGLTGLQELNLQDTRITDASLADLQKALPKTRIFR